jgi:tRNA U54 and U55 pseudouridine synthase Pus10
MQSFVLNEKRLEVSLHLKEEEEAKKEAEKDKCFICDHKGHKIENCWYYDATKAVE